MALSQALYGRICSGQSPVCHLDEKRGFWPFSIPRGQHTICEGEVTRPRPRPVLTDTSGHLYGSV